MKSNRFALTESFRFVSMFQLGKVNMEHVMNIISDTYILIFPDGQVAHGNKKAAEMLTCSMERLYEKNMSIIFIEESWNKFLKEIEQVLAKEPLVVHQFKLVVDGGLFDQNYHWFMFKADTQEDLIHIVAKAIS